MKSVVLEVQPVVGFSALLKQSIRYEGLKVCVFQRETISVRNKPLSEFYHYCCFFYRLTGNQPKCGVKVKLGFALNRHNKRDFS